MRKKILLKKYIKKSARNEKVFTEELVESNLVFVFELKRRGYRSRGWVSISGFQQVVDVAYRKVGDGHPLRLWRVWTQVEAPPREVLHRILRQRHFWDPSLVKWRVVSKLGDQAEVFQYCCADMPPLPNKDYCVVRYVSVFLFFYFLCHRGMIMIILMISFLFFWKYYMTSKELRKKNGSLSFKQYLFEVPFRT